MAPPRKQSDSRIHFANNDSRSKICKHCKQVVKTSGNTSNLMKHLIRKYPLILTSDASTPDNLPSIDEPSPSTSKNVHQENVTKNMITNFIIKHSTVADQSITNAIMLMIACDYQPFPVVNDYGFR